ncbi:RagB/SusD family nutrient uptake outer membrane protein [Pedobacter sp. AW31-3R]|uniref:RagB/SusD family nutrient uptake outer membrane protein n=1 Tax=Pedobacter sp. AW31-3R TaxID=3445781 RepID=UPI003F9FA9AE
MKNNINKFWFFLFLSIFSFLSCKKDYLNHKPSTNIVQPKTLDNLIGLLDNSDIINKASSALPILSADEYMYVDHQTWQASPTATERNAYIWAKDIFGGEPLIKDWTAPYAAIFYANNVLSILNDIPKTAENSTTHRFVEAWALFVRANSFYDLANNFCKAYDSNTAVSDLGIPIRLKPEIDVIEQRSTLQQTYDQILSDLNRAVQLFSSNSMMPTEKKNRPSLVAGYGLMARIYLNIRDYSNAELYADSCLMLYPNLINYQNLVPSIFPFDQSNEETLYSTTVVNAYISASVVFNNNIFIDSTLLATYKKGDLRKTLFFSPMENGYVMAGNYFGPALQAYTGIATDEVYLIKAECSARRGNIDLSMGKLNELLIKRYTSASYIPLTAATQKQALDLVLLERRKELVWRGLRWFDIKRLNREGAEIKLTRIIGDVTYTLLPDDPRFIFPIPDDEIGYTGIVQNQR